MFPREVLNRLKWSENGGLDGVTILYIHRGAPGDTMSIRGEEIIELERSFFLTADSKIPYHRIKRIEKGGEVLYEDRSSLKDE